MSVEALVAAVAQCAAVPVDRLRAMGDWVDDHAAPQLHRLAAESHRPELGHAVAALGSAREAIDRALFLIDSATQVLQTYTATLTGPPAPPTPPIAPTRPSKAHRVDAVRARLAPPLPGGRTAGVWIEASGQEHDLVSGNRDEWFTAAADYARQRGWVKGRAVLGLARHVEVKFAMRLRARHTLRRPGDPSIDETIVIDRPPCGITAPGDWTCDATLDDWLPPGATLTVIDRDGNRYTYRGTEDP